MTVKLSDDLRAMQVLALCAEPGRRAAIKWLQQRIEWEGQCAAALDYLRCLCRRSWWIP